MSNQLMLHRRQLIKGSLASAGILALARAGMSIPEIATRLNLPIAEVAAESLYIEAWPTSPLINQPFRDALPIPQTERAFSPDEYVGWTNWKTGKSQMPGGGPGMQDSDGGTHQIWPDKLKYGGSPMPDPLVYRLKLEVGTHSFTSSTVTPIGRDGKMAVSFDASGRSFGPGASRILPTSVIYGFNGGFPGARINAEYGRPALIRFENHLDENPYNYGRSDFGSPEMGFITHLHNGHTAPESDGNPNYRCHQPGATLEGGYAPGQFVDNLYLNWPAGGREEEKQSFFWFHDHYHNHTGANVYKGLVGLYPIYDPKLDSGDETRGLRLPGVRLKRDGSQGTNPDGTFDMDYDIPMALYDVRIDDGVTPHKDAHGGDGSTRPRWWGQTFFKHFPNHGFVGDIFTVNGMAYPVLEVKRRRYRLRFLDASISRIYDLKLMSSNNGPKSAVSLGYQSDDLQGQFRLPDGQQCMKWTQIAAEGGLLTTPIVRDNFELWPAKRREMVVDFSRYMDGSPTKKGDVIYMVNTMKMLDGRMWNSPDPAYKVPLLKIVIGDDAPDNSVMPTPGMKLRDLPQIPTGSALQTLINKRRVFRLERGGGNTQGSPENEWMINGTAFDETRQFASVRQGAWEAWEIQNGGGGWVHPLHIHQEEHQVVMRNGKAVHPALGGKADARHPDDNAKEDVVATDPSESVVFVRQFRTFKGRYVAHCHNLAHEDHSMMFGWEIV